MVMLLRYGSHSTKETGCRWLQSVCRTTDGPQDPRHMPSPQIYSTGFCSEAETKTVLYAPKKWVFCLVHFQSENSQPRAHTSTVWEERPSPIPRSKAARPQVRPHPDSGVRPLFDVQDRKVKENMSSTTMNLVLVFNDKPQRTPRTTRPLRKIKAIKEADLEE